MSEPDLKTMSQLLSTKQLLQRERLAVDFLAVAFSVLTSSKPGSTCSSVGASSSFTIVKSVLLSLDEY